jgi:L-fuconolactonase
MKLADAHLHLFRRGYHDRYGRGWAARSELDLYEALRQAHGIERGLVIGYEGQPRFRGNNRDLAAWARKHPWITPLAFVPAGRPPSAAALEKLFRVGFAGIAIYCDGPKEAERVRDWPAAVANSLGERRAIVSVNSGPDGLGIIAPFLARLAGGSVLVSHLGLPGSHPAAPSRVRAKAILAPLIALARQPHVGVKVSGLYAVSDPSHAYPHVAAHPFIRVLHDAFGPGRLCWGSDFSPALEHVSFAQTIDAIHSLGWPDSVVRGVLGGNLSALLRTASAGS